MYNEPYSQYKVPRFSNQSIKITHNPIYHRRTYILGVIMYLETVPLILLTPPEAFNGIK